MGLPTDELGDAEEPEHADATADGHEQEMGTAEGLPAEEIGDAEEPEHADATADVHEQDAFDDSAFNEAFEEAYAEGQEEEHMVEERGANTQDQSMVGPEDGEVIGG